MEPTVAELLARIAELERAKPSGGLKIAAKGGISIYGLGRFPVTLYASQWNALFDRADEVKRFLVDNAGKYKVKPEAGE